MRAPARRTWLAVAINWNSVSTEHGPAMVTNSSPPTSRSSTGTIVCLRRALFRHIGGLGKSLAPIFTHPVRSVSGEAESSEYRECPCCASIQRWRRIRCLMRRFNSNGAETNRIEWTKPGSERRIQSRFTALKHSGGKTARGVAKSRSALCSPTAGCESPLETDDIAYKSCH